MESEKVKEIKKVLECCKDRDCVSCPRFSLEPKQEDDCRLVLLADIITLINHQDFQIGTLKVQVEKLGKELKKEQINHLYYRQDSQFKESRIAELEKENANKTDTIADLLKKQAFYETEKLKQFAERLIEKKVKLGDRFNIYDIDETLKECLCEKQV